MGKDDRRSSWVAALEVLSNLVAKLADRFGWPGACVLGFLVFVACFGTEEQKQFIVQQLIDNVFADVGPAVVAGVTLILFVLALSFQQRSHRLRVEAKDTVIHKLQDERTTLRATLKELKRRHDELRDAISDGDVD